jgi:hypothetical protein
VGCGSLADACKEEKCRTSCIAKQHKARLGALQTARHHLQEAKHKISCHPPPCHTCFIMLPPPPPRLWAVPPTHTLYLGSSSPLHPLMPPAISASPVPGLPTVTLMRCSPGRPLSLTPRSCSSPPVSVIGPLRPCDPATPRSRPPTWGQGGVHVVCSRRSRRWPLCGRA